MVRQRSLLLPVILIAAGAIFLVGNLGLVPWASLGRLVDLWPLVLIVAGLELIIRRGVPRPAATPLALGVVAAAAAVAVAYVAVAPPLPASTFSSTSASAPLAGASSGRLAIDVAAADLTVRAGDTGSDLYRASFGFPADEQPRVTVSGGEVSITSPQSAPHFLWTTRVYRRTIDVTLNQALPWTIRVDGGAADGSMDLRGLKLAGFNVSGGAARLDLSLPQPDGTVRIDATGGAQRLTIHRPAGVEASVRVSGGAGNLTADGDHRSGLGSDLSWSSPGYSGATDRYAITVTGGASSVTLDATA